MAVQKPVFLAWYAAGQGFAAADWWQVVRHGLSLDMTVAGYVTALPVLLVLLSLWVRLPQRPVRRVLTGYFIAGSIVAG
ncbi:MAG: LTA synthase family protein, partial [Alistipes sp.]|nr:LTA synthase family protein [Alistipes sp.]